MNYGRHFFIGIPGPHLDSKTQKVLKTVRPGGIILFARNVQSPTQLAGLTKQLRKMLGRQLLICLDHEGGRVNRLKELVGVVPSAMQLGYLGNRTFAAIHGELTGRLLFELGVNVNLAPVLDLHLRPRTDNSVPDRCWSRNPRTLARLAGAFLESMQIKGVSGCGKHFIGYGAADKDPHLLLPRVTRTRTQILKEDMAPYSLLLPKKGKTPSASHLRMIMLSHAHLRAFHGSKLTPACISPLIAGELMRSTLQFKGVVITDDLEMGAITRTMSIGEATVKCLAAGSDFILICHTFKAILEGYRSAGKAIDQGLLTSRQLKESDQRLNQLIRQTAVPRPFSQKRFDLLKGEIKEFTRKIFDTVPPRLRVIDERWGPIGEVYK